MSSGGNAENGCTGDEKISTFEWLTSSVNLLQSLRILQPPRNLPVVEFSHPSVLKKKVELSLRESGEDDERVAKLCEDVVKHSVITNHPHFHNQLYGGTDPYGLVGALITEALNTNQYTFEVAPVFTLCEHEIVQRFVEKLGYGKGDGIFVPGELPKAQYLTRITFEVAPVFTLIEHEIINKLCSIMRMLNGDGIFSPGGSLNNMYAMVLARHRLEPEIKKKGLYCSKTIVAITSEDAHYSILKGVNWLGIGTDNLIKVKTDERGKMIPEELEKAILTTKAEGRVPFFVNATAGTTVLGAFDPIGKIADICRKHDIWLHVDACWGGSLMFSKKHSKVVEDLHRADSVAWNAHKMLGAPLQCSMFVTKHKGLLYQANCASATYLFQKDKFYDVSYDTGDKSVQCGRKVDAFKLWLMWKARGDSGFERLVDQAMACSRYFKTQIANRAGFRLVLPEFECTNICFWFIPKRLRDLEETEEWWDEVGKVAPQIKEKLTYAGSVMIGYQPINHKNLRNFFRLINTCHPERRFDDMDFIIKEVEFHGENL